MNLSDSGVDPLIRKARGAGLEINDAAAGKAVLQDVVLHDAVVFVGVDAEVWLAGGAVGHHGVEDPVDRRKAADAVNDVVGAGVVEPLPVNGGVARLRRTHEDEVGDDGVPFQHHIPLAEGDVPADNGLRRVAVDPLTQIPILTHDLPGRCENGHNGGDVGGYGGSDGHFFRHFGPTVRTAPRSIASHQRAGRMA